MFDSGLGADPNGLASEWGHNLLSRAGLLIGRRIRRRGACRPWANACHFPIGSDCLPTVDDERATNGKATPLPSTAKARCRQSLRDNRVVTG